MTNAIITWIEHEAEVIWGDIETEAEAGVKILWSIAKPLLTSVEPMVIADLQKAILAVLATVEAGGSLADIETALLNQLEADGSDLLNIVKTLGSDLVQALIALIKGGGSA